MTPTDLLLYIYCLVDDELRPLLDRPLRRAGPAPTLTDAELLPLEIAGELFGLTDDTALFRFFSTYHSAEFPALGRIDRTTFIRQAANLWNLKRRLQERLARRLDPEQHFWIADRHPIPACKFGRAPFCKRYWAQARYGYDHANRQTFYGFRLHLRVSGQGLIHAFALASAEVSDSAMLKELEPPPGSTGLGDRNYWDPVLKQELAAKGITFHAPFKTRKHDPDPKKARRISKARWIVETVQGQLVERLGIRRPKVKDLWHLQHRIIRKVLAHTVGFWLNRELGQKPLQFARLVGG